MYPTTAMYTSRLCVRKVFLVMRLLLYYRVMLIICTECVLQNAYICNMHTSGTFPG